MLVDISAFFGTTRCGKTMIAEHICEMKYFNQNAKIIDLTNDRVLESVGFMKGTRIKRFRNLLFQTYRISTEIKNILKNGIPTEILVPITFLLPEKLPPSFKLYSIPLDFFMYQDVMRTFTGDSLSEASYVSLSQETKNVNDNESLPAIPAKILDSSGQKILKVFSHGVPFWYWYDASTSATSANRPILQAMESGIFSSSNFKYALTNKKIESIIKDNRTITSFTNRFIDDRLSRMKIAINLYLLDKIREIAKRSGENIVVYIKEARNLFPNSRTTDKGLKVLSDQAESMIKDCGKSGITLLLDTQNITDLPEQVSDQIGLKIILRHDGREANILESYSGIPSMDKERIKQIKRLRNYHFFVSSTEIPLSMNRFNGLTLDYKLTDHLEPKENELDYIARIQPRNTWYQTKEYIAALRENWMNTSDKYKGKFERIHGDDQKKMKAKILGIAGSDMRVLTYLYKNRNKKKIKFTDLLDSLGIPKSTVESSVNRLHYRGFINRSEGKKEGYIAISETGLNFINENIEDFDL